jgi:eukaryotic-like serine/threonine-protein kinase
VLALQGITTHFADVTTESWTALSPPAALSLALTERYILQRELGRGGMATVYLAEDLKHDREVALKVVHPELAATLGPERFQREIRTTARLQHPHILPVLDSGEAAGQLWYTMPYVRGESLRDRLRRVGQLPIEMAVELTRQVALALDYAHREGVVHRDLKPENILISEGQALVADFGVAKAVSARGSQLTQTGVTVGTPAYMSPEQAAGGDVDGRSDVYALGCVLYEMLAGCQPFTGPSAQAIMARHALDPVPALRTLRATVPDALEDTVLASLSKVPGDRPQTAARLVELLTAPGVISRGPHSRTSATRRINTARTAGMDSPPAWWRKPRVWGLTASIVAAGTAAWLVIAGRAVPSASPAVESGPQRTHIAVLYFADDSPNHELAFLASGLTESLIRTLTGVNGLSVVSQAGVAKYRAGSLPRDSIARALKVGTLVAGNVEPEHDSIRVTARLLDDAGVELDRVTLRRHAKNLVALSENLTDDVARLIRNRIGKAVEWDRTRAGTRSTDAWERYQRAVLIRTKGDSLFSSGDTAGSLGAYRTADSLAAVAETLDPRWSEPSVFRGVISYRRSRHTQNVWLANLMIDSALGHAGRALGLNPKSSDAVELRGTLKYWRWLLQPPLDSAHRNELLASAQSDLEDATRLNPAQASAYASLSHLYNNATGKTLVDVIYAANKALEMDAYLDNADVIIRRLAIAEYDGGHFTDAGKWCEEGRRRFPENPQFVECGLLMMTTNLKAPDPDRAWKLADSFVVLTRDPGAKRYAQQYARLLVAAVLARAQRADSARSLLNRVQGGREIDPSADLKLVSAFVWTLLGDNTEALADLRAYYDVNPGRRGGFQEDPGWWFRPLAEDPRYRELVAAPH